MKYAPPVPTVRLVAMLITDRPVVSEIKRVSKPGRRVYADSKHLPRVIGGLGVSILTTSRGVMTGKQAKAAGVGGEVLCSVY